MADDYTSDTIELPVNSNIRDLNVY